MKLFSLSPLWAATALCLVLTCGCKTTQPDRFSQVDTNQDGQLAKEEANLYLVTTIFETRDKNGDKKLTKEEWLVAGDAGQEKIFVQRDANRDNVVTVEEAIAYGNRKGQAVELIKLADKDKNGTLSRQEVVAYYASKEGPVR